MGAREVYSTKPTDAVLHESGLVQVKGIVGRRFTAVPLVDKSTALFARLYYPTAIIALAQYGLRLPTYEEIGLLKDAAIRGDATMIAPYTLPTTEMISRMPPKAVTETEEGYQTRIRQDMSSLAWANEHDSEVWRRIEKAGWNRLDPLFVMNVGKWFQAGAPKGRCFIRGWWDTRKLRFIQGGATSGNGPHGEWECCDYGTLTIGVQEAA